MGLTTRFYRSGGPRTLRVRTGTPLATLTSDMDELFAPLWRGLGAAPVGRAGGSFWPRIDLIETADAVRVTAELPGVGAEDFSVVRLFAL